MTQPDDRHQFRMVVKDGIGRDREVRIHARKRKVTIFTPPGSESFQLDPDQCDTFNAAVAGACERARKQAP